MHPLVRVVIGVIARVLASFVVACVTSGWASAGEPPGDWWRERMNQDFSVRPAARVSGPFGKLELSQPRAEEGGLRAESIRSLRGGAVQAGFAENDPKLLAWSSIERIEVPTRATGFGALMGAFAGTAAALVVALAADDPTTHSAVRPAAIMAGGACLGAFVGATQQRWNAYYPPPDRGLRVHPVARESR